MIKGVLTATLASAVLLSIETANTFTPPHCPLQSQNFIDKNLDGICDYAGSGGFYTDANGDDICDNYASGNGGGGNYTDANGDGICDNYASGAGPCYGGGNGYGGNGYQGGRGR